MPSSIAHYAVGAALLAVVGLRGRQLALGALIALVPDLDLVTAIPWALAAPHLPLGADALVQGAYLFGHRGLSHTFLMALIVAGLVWVATRSRRWSILTGVMWASHVALDTVSPWPTTPYWPFSTVKLHTPVVTGLDPILTLVSAATMLALIAPLIAERWGRATAATTADLSRLADRWGHRLAYASLAAVLFNVAWLGAVAAVNDVPFEDTYSANVPRTVTVLPDGDAWQLERRWAPWDDPTVERIPKAANRTFGPGAEEALATAKCTIDDLGPYSPIDDPIWVARPGEEGLVVEAIDLVRNATDTGSPRLLFTFSNGTLLGVDMTGEGGEDAWFRVAVPDPVVEAARCP